MQPFCLELIRQAKVHGLTVILTCTYRSNAEQAALYAYGRNGNPGPKRTNAPPGSSLHNFTQNGKPAARAFDVAIIEHGKCNWDAQSPAWKQLGAIGEELGLEWGMRWKSFPEAVHFQKVA